MTAAAPALRCRAIAEADLCAVAAVLRRGFPDRPGDYWTHALEVLRTRDAPLDYSRFGLLLEADSACVGVLLQIYTRLCKDGTVRCNLSSWYVDPAYRSYAPLFVSRALRHKDVTYLNVSAAEHTWPILLAQGYRRYSEGQVAALSFLSSRGVCARVRRWRGGEACFSPETGVLLDAHAALGLIVLVCERGAERAAFAFLPREVRGVGRRVAQLAWCEDTASFLRFAGPLGRWLLWRGWPLVLLDACGPTRGLVGRFFKDRAPKFFRGGQAPRLNDLAYTEAVLFGG